MTTTDPSHQRPDLRVVGPLGRYLTVADLVGTYARMADELAAMVEAERRRSVTAMTRLAATLRQLHTELDELAAKVVRGEC